MSDTRLECQCFVEIPGQGVKEEEWKEGGKQAQGDKLPCWLYFATNATLPDQSKTGAPSQTGEMSQADCMKSQPQRASHCREQCRVTYPRVLPDPVSHWPECSQHGLTSPHIWASSLRQALRLMIVHGPRQLCHPET